MKKYILIIYVLASALVVNAKVSFGSMTKGFSVGLTGEYTLKEGDLWVPSDPYHRLRIKSIGLEGNYLWRPFGYNCNLWTNGFFVSPGAGVLRQDELGTKMFVGEVHATVGYSLRVGKTQLNVFTGPEYSFSKSQFFESEYDEVIGWEEIPTGRRIKDVHQVQGRGWYWQAGIGADWGHIGVTAAMLFSIGPSEYNSYKWEYVGEQGPDDYVHATEGRSRTDRARLKIGVHYNF